MPDKPTLDNLEERWAAAWEEAGTYHFDDSATRSEVFSIDTPPPTVSGSLHMGSVFGYVQTDAIARYRRMRGWKLFYPMGWDDNGLPTERRVQTYFGVTCDPSLPYDPDFTPPEEPGKSDIPVSRPNFIALCHQLTSEDERVFEDLWRRVGLSVDWGRTYATIDDKSRRTSQRMFLRNLARGEAYTSEAPTLWDVDFQTAVAQAEMEDRELDGAYHRLRFDDIEIETTRPELVAACVALVAHPDDERYEARFGSTVHTPLFGVEVPVLAHHLAEPDKGSGIAMICTFGDVTDVVWWRELALPTSEHRDALGPHHRVTSARRSRRRSLAGHRRQDREAGATGHGGVAGRIGGPDRRPAGNQAPGEILRAGKPPPRDRHEPTVVHPQRRSGRGPAGARSRAGEPTRLAPALHAGPFRRLGARPQR